MHRPKLKPHQITQSEKGISLLFAHQNEPLVLAADRAPLLTMLNGEHSIKEIWEKLLVSGSTVKLSEIYLTVERLKKHGGLDGTAVEEDFEKNWLDFSIAKLKVIKRKSSALRSETAFTILSASILCLSVVSIYFVYSDLTFHGFLQISNSYLWSVPLLVFIFSTLGLLKGLVKLISIVLATGEWPDTSLCYRGLMFDLKIDESKILIEGHFTRRLYQLNKAFCFLFLGVALSSFIQSDLARQIQITALLMTFIWFNPYRKSEFTQVVSSFFDDEEIRYIKPFLRKKSLTGFVTNKKEIKSEKKLAVVSSLSLAWTFLFIGFAQDLVLANGGFWLAAFSSGSMLEKLSAGFITVALTGLSLVLLYDLFRILYLNFLNLFIKKSKSRAVDAHASFDRSRLSSFFANVAFFNNLESRQIEALASKVKIKTFSLQQRVIVEGELGHEMYIILQGQAQVQKEMESGFIQKYAVLEDGAVFGEVALLEKGLRTADVIALSDLTVAVLSEDQFREIWGSGNEEVKTLLKQKVSLTRYLSSSPVFKGLPVETNQLFITGGIFENFDETQKIVERGAQDKSFYLLLEGEVSVEKDSREIATLKQGDFFGEMALFENKVRSADVVARKKCLVLKLDKDSFWKVVTENMELAFSLEYAVQSRGGVAHAN
ncbi:MAG: cyclic nucleotide-binding domain-containing protein [Pseudobdellovibrio sp.]